MILKVFIDDLGYPVYEEVVDSVDEGVFEALERDRVVRVSDDCVLELL